MSLSEHPSPEAAQPVPGSAAELRAQFDRRFALPATSPSGKARDFVMVEANGRCFALPVLELQSIEQMSVPRSSWPDGKTGAHPGDHLHLTGRATDAHTADESSALPWVAMPSSQPALLGIRGFAGQILPVFSLSRLLHLGSSPSQPVPGFCALVLAGEDLVGLAFDVLLRLVRAEPEHIIAPTGDATSGESWQAASLHYDGLIYPVISISALLAALTSPPARDQHSLANPISEDEA